MVPKCILSLYTFLCRCYWTISKTQTQFDYELETVCESGSAAYGGIGRVEVIYGPPASGPPFVAQFGRQQSLSCRPEARGPAFPSGIYRRSRVRPRNVGSSEQLPFDKYEPRFKPPRETLASGETLIFNYLPLGSYDTVQDAQVVHQIAAFHYGKGEDQLDLGDGHYFFISSSLSEQERQERHPSGREQSKWVSRRTKKIFEDYKKAKAARGLVIETNGGTSIHSSEQITEEPGASSSPVIYTHVEGLASSSQVGPSTSAANIVHAGEHDMVCPVSQHLGGFVAPAINQGHNDIDAFRKRDISDFLEQGNFEVDNELGFRGEILYDNLSGLDFVLDTSEDMLDARLQHSQDNQGQGSTSAAQIFDGSFPSDTISTFFEDNVCNVPEGALIGYEGLLHNYQANEPAFISQGSDGVEGIRPLIRLLEAEVWFQELKRQFQEQIQKRDKKIEDQDREMEELKKQLQEQTYMLRERDSEL